MRSVGRLAVSFLLVCACNSAHTATSTETGNPPVIDVDKISLVVGADDVQIVGAPGAVKPGGSEVELAILGSDEVARAKSKPDGSFSVTVDAKPDAVVEVSASSGEMRSSSVYVTRGGATVGSGKGNELTCMERSNLASQVVGSVFMNADTSCQTAADCVQVDNKADCADSCGGPIVSVSAVDGIVAAFDMINDGVCADFAADGCSVIALPCPPPAPGVPACVDGQCMLQTTQVPACPSCLNQVVQWGNARSTPHSLSNCDQYEYTTPVADSCRSTVPHCDSGRVAITVEDVLIALADPAVQQAVAEEKVFGLPAPGGLAPKITVDGKSFVIASCGTDPSCMIPDGITRLKNLLDSIAAQSGCQ